MAETRIENRDRACLSVRDVRYSYPGRPDTGIHGVSFEVAPGEVFALLGPSGAGKTTTVKVALGLLSGFAGEVTFDGVSMRNPPRSVYEQIGVAFEVPRFYPGLTARENLALFASLYRTSVQPVEPMLSRVGLSDAIDTRIAAYSKGMRMRLNLCRAVMHRPSLLLLDEPTAGLDPVNAAVVKTWIRELADDGMTVLLTTHNMEVADQLSDRVGFVVAGKLETTDSPTALKRRYGSRDLTVEYRTDDHVERARFPLDGLAKNAEFYAVVANHHVEAIHSGEVTLEEVFLAVTGRGLR